MTASRLWKILLLAETIDNLPEPFIPRTAITRKQDPNTINLNRSKTSQEARKIEDQLAADLEKQYNKIVNDTQKDVSILQRTFGPTVEQLIRSAVQKLYLIGADYATKTQNTTAFITQTDLANIKKQVDATSAAFWRRVYDAIHKSDIIIPTQEPKEPVDPAIQAALISTVTATATLALSTLSKLNQIPNGTKRKLVWITEQDAKVCQICRPLHGQEWDEDDPFMKKPGPDTEGGDTHHRCRCRLLIKDGEDILTG